MYTARSLCEKDLNLFKGWIGEKNHFLFVVIATQKIVS